MGWRERKHEETYSDAEVDARLKEGLAHKIEEMVMWQPGKEGGALEGTPATHDSNTSNMVKPLCELNFIQVHC